MAGTTRRRRNKASLHPRHMTPDKDFTPLPLSEGDELFPNGIFEFNITKMLAYIETDSGGFPAGETGWISSLNKPPATVIFTTS